MYRLIQIKFSKDLNVTLASFIAITYKIIQNHNNWTKGATKRKNGPYLMPWDNTMRELHLKHKIIATKKLHMKQLQSGNCNWYVQIQS
jgi:hypothetical protein